MATNFPSSLDSLTNPTASDKLNSVTVPHATQHANVNDAVEALEAKVGVDSSAVATSLDYKVAQLEAGATANAIVAYADLAARTAANPSPSEGDVSWQEDTNRFDIYNGTTWAQVAVGGTYTDYSGSITISNLTIGNGTIFAKYTQVNDLVHYWGYVQWGSTTSLSGNPTHSVPVAADTAVDSFGRSACLDNGTNDYHGVAQIYGGTNMLIRPFGQDGAGYIDYVSLSASVPFTWTTSDRWTWSIVYKAA